MDSYKYCIIGGGPAGIGVLDGLLKNGETDIILFEGRDTFLYTLSLMLFIKKSTGMFAKEITGKQFRKFLLGNNDYSRFANPNSRLIGLDKENRSCTVNINGEKNLEIKYGTLIIASGAIQSIYGKELLPGFRGAGTFTTYQISEMLTQYSFLPGKNLGIIGDSEYALETALTAESKGLNVTLFSHSLPGKNCINYKSILGLQGDEHISSVEIETDSGEKLHYPVDSLAVDGEFSMEHKLRDLIGIEWDINAWQTGTEHNQQHPDFENIYLAGDAFKPKFNFLEQYENGYNLAGGLT